MLGITQSKSRGLIRQIQKRWQLFLFVLPAVVYLILFDYRPMYGIVIAFQDYKLMKGITGSRFVGFRNFSRLFSSYWFPIILRNTLSISLLTLIIGFPVPILLALMVNEVKAVKMKKMFQTVSYAPHLMNRALDYIREHFTSNDLSLDATAAHCGVSAAYLSRSFKNNMGIGYIDYVTELRMNEARKLLLNTSLSVSDISLRVGYIDVSSFRKKFRQVMGVSIQETREDQRKEDDPRKDD